MSKKYRCHICDGKGGISATVFFQYNKEYRAIRNEITVHQHTDTLLCGVCKGSGKVDWIKHIIKESDRSIDVWKREYERHTPGIKVIGYEFKPTIVGCDNKLATFIISTKN